MGSRLFNIVSLYNYLLSVYDIQSLLQGAESLALEGVDMIINHFLVISHYFYSCRLCFELASEGLLAVLHSDGVTAFRIGRDVDVQTYDVACVDVLFIYGFA